MATNIPKGTSSTHCDDADLVPVVKEESNRQEDVSLSPHIGLNKDPALINIVGCQDQIPILIAIAHKRRDMVLFLLSRTKFEDLDDSTQNEIFIGSISSDYYDIALDLLKQKPNLAWGRRKNDDTALHVLARKSSATISSSHELCFLKKQINSRFGKFYSKTLMGILARQLVEDIWRLIVENLTIGEMSKLIRTPTRVLHDAARVGNAEVLIILIKEYLNLVLELDDDGNSIFHVAVENRHEEIFTLIFELGGIKDVLLKFYNKDNYNMLHLVGKLPALQHLNRVSGAALQMQREIFWFKAVEKVMLTSPYEMRHSISLLSEIKTEQSPSQSETEQPSIQSELERQSSQSEIEQPPSPNHLTPHELFTKEHKELLKNGERRMKQVAQTYMLAATLIAVGIFAATFMLAGGISEETNTPNLRNDPTFVKLLVANSLALVSSLTSLFFFVSICSSDYTEENFVRKLLGKLLIGVLLLLISVACIMLAFGATIVLVYHKKNAHILSIIIGVLIIPVISVCLFHWKDVWGIMRSAYWERFCLRPCRRRLS